MRIKEVRRYPFVNYTIMEPQIFLAALLLLTKGCVVLAQRVEFVTQSTPTMCATSYLQPANCGQFSVPAIIKPIISEPAPIAPIVPSFPDYSNYPMPPIIIARDNHDDWHHLLYFLIFALAKNKGGNDCGYSNGNNGCGGNYGCNCGGYGCGGCGGWGCGGCGCGGYGCGGCGYGGCGNGCGCGFCGIYPLDAAAAQGGNSGGNSGNSGGSDANSGGSDANSGGSDSSNNSNGGGSGGNNIIYVPYPMPCGFPCPSFPYPDNMPSSPDFYPCPAPSLPPCDCDCKDEINFIIKTDCK